MFTKLLTCFTVFLLVYAVFVAVDMLYSSDSSSSSGENYAADEKCVGTIIPKYKPKMCKDYGEDDCGGTVSFTRTSARNCKGTYAGHECAPKEFKGASGTQDCKWINGACHPRNQKLKGTIWACTDRPIKKN